MGWIHCEVRRSVLLLREVRTDDGIPIILCSNAFENSIYRVQTCREYAVMLDKRKYVYEVAVRHIRRSRSSLSSGALGKIYCGLCVISDIFIKPSYNPRESDG